MFPITLAREWWIIGVALAVVAVAVFMSSHKRKVVGKGSKKNPKKQKEDEEDEPRVPLGRSLTSQMMEDNVEKEKEKGKDKEPEKPTYDKNAKTIQDLGYKFQDRKLVDAKTGGKFQFINQEHYELLGDLVLTEIQHILRTELKMVEAFVPEKSEEQANIFHSPDLFTNEDVLLVLICGSGAVKAGQWARSLCINDSLNNGTIIPYLDDAHASGFSSIVLNPNFCTKTLPSPIKHSSYVWDNYIAKSPAKKIIFVAHSYGGVITVNLLEQREEQILARVKGIAFTDSVHSLNPRLTKEARAFLAHHARNWVKSKEPLDTLIHKKDPHQGCRTVSAGHDVHEYTSGVARPSVFEYLKECLASF